MDPHQEVPGMNALDRTYPDPRALCSANPAPWALGSLRPFGATDAYASGPSAFVVVSKHPVPFRPSMPAGGAQFVPYPIAPAILLILVEVAPLADPYAGRIHGHQMDHPLRRTTASKGYHRDTLRSGRR